jgi:GAF domain-containing protein
MEDELSRHYWDAYRLSRAVYDVNSDTQPSASSRAAFVHLHSIDYALAAKVDPDFQEPPPVVLSNGVVLKSAAKLRRYAAGTRLPPAHAGTVPQSSLPSVVPYTWDGVSWASHRKDASIVMYTLSSPPVGSTAPVSALQDEEQSGDRLVAVELPLGVEAGGRGGLAAFVAASGLPLLTTNAAAHHAYSTFPFSQSARPAPASMMLVPVLLQGWDGAKGERRVVMVLEVGDKIDGGSYTRDDIVLLTHLSCSVSSVLEHVERSEKTTAQASLMLSASGTSSQPPILSC